MKLAQQETMNKSNEALVAYVNGKFLPLTEATVHIEDRGFQFADGVYEVVACFNGHFLDLDAHLERLQRSCEAIRIELPLTIEAFNPLITRIYHDNPFKNAMIYIQVTRGVTARSHLPSGNLKPTIVLTSRQLPIPSDEKIAQGASAITLPDMRWKRCDIKSIALLASVLGKQEAALRDADEACWVDEQQHVLEGCSTNIFAVIKHVLVTHPLDHQVLGGITRQMILRLAATHGIPYAERPWTLDETGLSECFMSSTTNAAMPITHINGAAIGDGNPGAVTLQLRSWMLQTMKELQQ